MTAETLKPHDDFIKRLFKFALPLLLQYLIINLLNLVDSLMIGSLGAFSISGVGLGNQVFFLTNLFMFGIVGGASIFLAQFWGKKDIDSIHKMINLALILCLAIAMIFTTAGTVFTKKVLSIYTTDQNVIDEGARYLSVAALSYIPFAFTMVYVAAMRSTGNVRVPLFASITALSINTFLNYCLIFGNFGMPQLGVRGAAIATVIARTTELIILMLVVYGKSLPVAAPLSKIFEIPAEFFKKVIGRILLVLANESAWAMGTTIYTVIYGRMGTDNLTVMNISAVVYNLAFVFTLGMGQALGIMIGNSLGARDFEKAKRDAKHGLFAAFIIGAIVGLIMMTLRGSILSLYNIPSEITSQAKVILTVMLAILPLNCVEFTLFIGILRAGGDTTFCTIVDVGALWLIGLPLALTGAFYLHLPLLFVFLLAKMESFSRAGACYIRYRGHKWVKDIT
ncbi:MAG: MATE family efflux transporter [Clostridia bacterium]|nr:MATE family efflux transporter [Clostridia bacterium]